jgi:hypothetical protein
VNALPGVQLFRPHLLHRQQRCAAASLQGSLCHSFAR